MMRSLNEVESGLKKAAMGAGFPIGISDEISRAGALLIIEGLDGVDAIYKAIKEGVAVASMPILSDGMAHFANTKIAINGPAAFDLMEAGLASTITLEEIDSPMLLIGFAKLAAETYGLKTEIDFSNGSEAEIRRSKIKITGPIDSGVNANLRITEITDQPIRVVHDNGVTINEVLWPSIMELAYKTYVPATEESRVKGAGAGLTDND